MFEYLDDGDTQYVSFNCGWIQLQDPSRIEQFLVEMAPSKINDSMGFKWISVYNPSKAENYEIPNVSALRQEYQQLRQLNLFQIERLARKYNVLSGKWMCFVPTSHVDYVWSCIARAVVQGRLGYLAKVAVSQRGGSVIHVICVYTNNYLDSVERKIIKYELKNILIEANTNVRRLSYKPDIYTHLGIYQNHPVFSETIDWIRW
ncbi:unnamed protein product [Didymodactylos carnosus]|uniref:Uncharacterized protein n=1 Tax=Didymodactylos carnosus TaxID=1234261 RepID=A0A815J5I1_9BILA|nr:unnamed protein product [Didymodactylos carnosus]CAF4266323.1 unnamed protein product [Didymodactylos carnosus]